MPPLARCTVLLLLLAVALLSAPAPACQARGHNVTSILLGRPGLAQFSRALAATGLADGIDAWDAVTVLAVDDARMAPLLQRARGLPREALRRALAPHVLAGYYDDATLRRLLHPGAGGSAEIVDVPTMLRAPPGSGTSAAGTVRIARERRAGGRVAFVPQPQHAGDGDARAAVFYVRPVHVAPYNVSVLLVSGAMSSPAAAPPEPPSDLEPSTARAPAPSEHRTSRARAHHRLELILWICVAVLASAVVVLLCWLSWLCLCPVIAATRN
ncbi:hypothetical protein ACP70R_021037 [Stipagrostis hirtigluma subsp. patula]